MPFDATILPLDEAILPSLTTAAVDAASCAYAPYSKFQVGAALLFEDGTIVSGANVENASFGLSCCAERNALFRAISARGPHWGVRAVAIFHAGPEACPPCGACLQVMSEFVALEGCIVYYSQGERFLRATFDELMPVRFGPGSL